MIQFADFFTYAAVGAAAQLVDGALGMAYGVTSAGMLMSLGMPPAMASASVHYTETFTCGASGLSHLWAGNVRRKLFVALVITGVIGALIGSLLLVHLPSRWIRIVLTPYLLLIGIFLLLRTLRSNVPHRTDVPPGTAPLGLVAGFLDAIGGGGWSAITVTALVARGMEPRRVIGSVHLAKCVVSLVASVSFLITLGTGKLSVIAGLIAGGVIAAPVGALLVRRIPPRVTTLLAGLTVLALGVNNAIALMR